MMFPVGVLVLNRMKATDYIGILMVWNWNENILWYWMWSTRSVQVYCLPMEVVHSSALTWFGCSKQILGKWPAASATLEILLISSTPHLKSLNFHKHWSFCPPSSFTSLQPTTYKNEEKIGSKKVENAKRTITYIAIHFSQNIIL